MATTCTLNYANIFMVRFEKKHIYPFIKCKVDLHLKYIDDIFFIWKGTEEELKNLFNKIIKSTLPLNLIKNIQKWKQTSSEF